MTMTLVSTVTSALQSSVTFTSIPQTGTDLYAIISVRGSQAADYDDLYVTFNGDSGNNYSTKILRTQSSTVTVVTAGPSFPNTRAGYAVTYGNMTANTFSNISMYIPNYALTGTKRVSFDGVGENNAATAYMSIDTGSYTGTSAITSITFSNTNYVAGCTFSLYTITKGSGGATVS